MSMSGGLKPLAPLGGSKFNDDDEDNDMSPKKKSFGGAKSLLGPIPDIKAFQQKKALAMDEFRKNQEEIEKRRAEQEEMQRAANISEANGIGIYVCFLIGWQVNLNVEQ